MKLGQSKIVQVLRHRAYLPFWEITGSLVDRYYGVSTQRTIELTQLGIPKDVGSRYQPVPYNSLWRIFKLISAYKLDSILDVGCGLGRPFVVAKQFAYKKYYGVDISEELIDLCLENTRRLGIKCDLSVCDIDEYQLPDGDLFIYLFNPFGEEKMKNLVRKIIRRSGRTLIAYHNPKHNNCLPQEYLKERVLWKHFGMYRETCEIYFFEG